MEAPRCFCLQRPKRDGTSYIIVEVAKALGVSFKLVKTQNALREMTQLLKETQKNGDINKSKKDK